MDQHILSIEMRAVTKAVDRYLGESMPQTARETTGGNAHIIMFLARNRDREIYQHTIEQKFCITRSTASRVLALMEKKGLIARESVAHDARCKRIVLTDKADAIVADLKANGERVERLLVDGFTQTEQDALHDYVERMRANIERISDLVFMDVPARLAKTLLNLGARFGEPVEAGLKVPHDLTQEELAQLVGSSRETVNKALMDFANRRWIAREGRSIIIYQPGMLIRRSQR